VKYVPPYGVTSNPDAAYVNGDPSIGRQGSIPPAAVFENPQREICNLITDSTQTPADGDLHQLTRGVRDGKLNFCVDSGPLNQLQVVLPGPQLAAYTAGLIVNVLVAHTNTGPTQISIGTLNPTTVKRPDGSELQAGDLLAGMVATLICDGTFFQCLNVSTGGGGGGGTVTTYKIDIPYVHDTGTANHLIGLYSPPLDNINEGRTVEIKLANNVTGPTDFTPNNFATHPVAHPDGTPIKAGDGIINQIWLLCFDGVQWQLLSVYWSAIPTPPGPLSTLGRSLQFHRGPNGAVGSSGTFLKRFPAMNGNRQVWSYSFFIRRPNADALPDITQPWSDGLLSEFMFTAGAGASGGDFTGVNYNGTPSGNQFMFYWNNSGSVISGRGTVDSGTNVHGYSITPLMMDTKWHHVLFNTDGAKMSGYVDGILVNQGNISGNGAINATRPQTIGAGSVDGAGSSYYHTNAERMAEIVMIDGQCLDWTKFAQNIGGIFIPKDVSALTFGLNGFHLNWSDSSAVTSTTLGKDVSGNGNNWTPVNFQITDVLTDYPG
jgi:Concanavalin A-like lectin/glucanases superfamily